MSRIATSTNKPIVVFSSTPANITESALRAFAEARIPVLPSPARAAKAIAMLARYRRLQSQMEQAKSVPIETDAAVPGIRQAVGTLSEAESKEILAAAGIPVTKDRIVRAVDDKVFAELTAPFVVKIVSPDIPHKTEIGGVKVGLRTRAELETAVHEVLQSARKHCPDARIDGVLISEMVHGGFELIAGVVNDAVFGPVVVAGAGGIYAELMKDSACRIAPFDEQTALEMLDELRCRPILNGARGSVRLDIRAAAKALAALSRFAWKNRDRISEIDINPLFVLPDGVVAADALIVATGTATEPAPKQLAVH